MQESLLFNDTLAANIAYGKPEASMEEIQNAAKAASAGGTPARWPSSSWKSVSRTPTPHPRNPPRCEKSPATPPLAGDPGAGRR